jgi:hypothetical protein
MSLFRKSLGLMVLILLLSSFPVSGQSGQQEKKTEPVPAPAPSVRATRTARFRLGGIVFGAGYSRFGGCFPYYSYPFGYPWYPYSYTAYPSLWYHPGWYIGFSYHEGMGEVKLRSNPEDADVFLDDGFAGKSKDLKTLWLEPGAYNLRVEAANHAPFSLRIYVLGGKTLKIVAKLVPNQER